MYSIDFQYDEESGISTARACYKTHVFYGNAYCHPNDKDMMSERTGCYIAEMRATIKMLKFVLHNELEPAFGALDHIIMTTRKSDKRDDNRIYQRLLADWTRYKDDIEAIKDEIASEQEQIETYIYQKEKLYQRIRAEKNN